MENQIFQVAGFEAGKTLAALLRIHLPGQSWNAIKRLVEGRRVRVGGYLCMDAARRLRQGEEVAVLSRPEPPPPRSETLILRYVDDQVVVVEKPPNVTTVRHPAERDWPQRRRDLVPTLDDMVHNSLARQEGLSLTSLPRLRVVHRLDKQTSGLLVFARTVAAERLLGKQFHSHNVRRRYLAIIAGYLAPQTISTRFVRDRGDGRRGSTSLTGQGKPAVTHVDVVERLPAHTVLACRLETGRTHQIRIHLAETGHPVCGDPVYHRLSTGQDLPDSSGAPRLALHAAELGFQHPATGAEMNWSSPLPVDLTSFLDCLRAAGPNHS
jgi:23S rRNA pseudouridine1911/1915/1917 synthase